MTRFLGNGKLDMPTVFAICKDVGIASPAELSKPENNAKVAAFNIQLTLRTGDES
jgi:hypothetical protein